MALRQSFYLLSSCILANICTSVTSSNLAKLSLSSLPFRSRSFFDGVFGGDETREVSNLPEGKEEGSTYNKNNKNN